MEQAVELHEEFRQCSNCGLVYWKDSRCREIEIRFENFGRTPASTSACSKSAVVWEFNP